MISDDVITNWYSDQPLQQGTKEKYSNICIEAIMMFKTVFRLAYRQSRGFTQGILKLMNLEHLEVPSFTHVNRRFRALDILPFDIPKSGSITITIDSTGIKV
jgi:hypothetical protein